jgi:hypothetical protein
MLQKVVFLIFFLIFVENVYSNNYFSKKYLSTSKNQFHQPTTKYLSPNSLKSDFARSVIGAAAGGVAGTLIVGYLPLFFENENDREDRMDAFYVRSYIGSSVGAAVGSATALYLSKNRDVSYWALTGAVILPPLLIVLPPSISALSDERDELLRAAWISAAISIGVSTIWAVIAYRIQPLKSMKTASIKIGEPFLEVDVYKNKNFVAGIRIVEFSF